MRRRIAGSANNSTLTASYAAFFVAVVALLVLLAAPTRAQDSSQDEYDPATGGRAQTDDQDLKFAPGIEVQTTSRADQAAGAGGPLVGTRVDARSTDDNDRFVEIIRIPGPTCRAEEGASFDLRDENGTLATFTDRDGSNNRFENVQIKETRAGLRVTSDGPDNDIKPVNERGGDGDLATGGLRVAASTGITCRNNGNVGSASGNGEDEAPENGAAVAAADEGGEAAENLLALDCDDLLERLRDREEGQYADRGFATSAVEARIDECREQEVIDETDTDENLPDTGGLPLLGIAVLGLASVVAGASVIRGAGRRE